MPECIGQQFKTAGVALPMFSSTAVWAGPLLSCFVAAETSASDRTALGNLKVRAGWLRNMARTAILMGRPEKA